MLGLRHFEFGAVGKVFILKKYYSYHIPHLKLCSVLKHLALITSIRTVLQAIINYVTEMSHTSKYADYVFL